MTASLSPDLAVLIHLFYSSSDELGRFRECRSVELPESYRELLAHDQHMTVACEARHGGPVDVRVLDVQHTVTHYSRKILLTRPRDQRGVLFGLVRLNLSCLSAEVRRVIESERVPLGRVLIEHNVLRTVRLLSLWRVEPGEELQQLLGLGEGEACYGRTALIYCDGVPAVELLEIVNAR